MIDYTVINCPDCGHNHFDPIASDETQVHKGNVFLRDRDGHELYVLFCPFCGRKIV